MSTDGSDDTETEAILQTALEQEDEWEKQLAKFTPQPRATGMIFNFFKQNISQGQIYLDIGCISHPTFQHFRCPHTKFNA